MFVFFLLFFFLEIQLGGGPPRGPIIEEEPKKKKNKQKQKRPFSPYKTLPYVAERYYFVFISPEGFTTTVCREGKNLF